MLQSDQNRTDESAYYRFTGGDLSADSNVSFSNFVFGVSELTVVLTEKDQTALKVDFGLAANVADTFLVVDAAMVEDTAGNPVVPLPVSDAMSVSELGTDTAPASITDIQVDMDAKTLSLKFNDVIDASSLKVQHITIQNNVTDLATESYILQTSSTRSADGYLMVIDLSEADELELNRIPGLATELANTFVAFTASVFDDMKKRDVIAITDGRQVSVFKDDITPPTLVRYEVDLSLETVVLVFSEAVDLGTFNASTIKLVSGPVDEPAGSGDVGVEVVELPLTGAKGPVTMIDNQTSITFKLRKDDLDKLKLSDELGTRANNTFIVFTSGMVDDMFGVAITAIGPADPQQVTVFGPDSVPPELVSFDVNMDTAQLTMLFSEPVRQESVVVPLNIEVGHEPTSGAVYSLSGGIVLDGDGLVIVINMTHFDMGVIKANPNLFVDADTSIIGMKRALATDLNGVSVSKLLVSDNVRADRYAADHTKPVLLNFAVDMVNGKCARSRLFVCLCVCS